MSRKASRNNFLKMAYNMHQICNTVLGWISFICNFIKDKTSNTDGTFLLECHVVDKEFFFNRARLSTNFVLPGHE